MIFDFSDVPYFSPWAGTSDSSSSSSSSRRRSCSSTRQQQQQQQELQQLLQPPQRPHTQLPQSNIVRPSRYGSSRAPAKSVFGPSSHLPRAFFLLLFCFLGLAASASKVIPSQFFISGLSADEAHAPFYHGVASADPGEDSILLWTRRTPDGAAATFVADDSADSSESYTLTYYIFNYVAEENAEPVSSGTVLASAADDFTAAALVEGLVANTRYRYHFVDQATGSKSSVGETRTAGGSPTSLRILVSSCSSIWSGALATYSEMAKQEDVNLVIHVGDYIYDYVDKDEAERVPSAIEDSEAADASEYNIEAVDSIAQGGSSLLGWRRVHSLHLLDPNLRAARQKHPFLVLWDNHDLGHDFESEDYDWNRVAQAKQAFREWVPNRRLRLSGETEVYQTLSYGGLADIIAIDILTHRNEYGSKNIMNEAQWDWFGTELAASAGRGTRWRLIPNQNMFVPWTSKGMAGVVATHLFTWMLFLLLGIAALCVFWPYLRVYICCQKRCACCPGLWSVRRQTGHSPVPTQLPQLPPKGEGSSNELTLQETKVDSEVERPGPTSRTTCCGCRLFYRICCCTFCVFIYIAVSVGIFTIFGLVEDVSDSEAGGLDDTSWDGYSSERVRFLDLIKSGAVQNTMVLSGDAHIGWAADLTSTASRDGRPSEGLGVEFGSNSISRGNVDEQIGSFLTDLILPWVGPLLQACNQHWVAVDYTQHGFGLLDINYERIQVTQYWVDFRSIDKTVTTATPLRMTAGQNRWDEL